MESTTTQQQTYHLDFKGSGGSYFGIIIVNWLLTVLTLGIYYPWAKAKNMKFIIGSSTLNNENFSFHGTGKEMFKGFLVGIMFMIIIGMIFAVFTFIRIPAVGIIVGYVAVFMAIPIAIHGSYRYRMSRTTWRGMRFGYVGDRNTLVKEFAVGIALTVVTLGIYGAWFVVRLRNYLLSHVRFGNVRFNYVADGTDYFILNLKGYLLTLVTLGIYFFWWQRDLFAFYVDHLSLHDENGKTIRLKSQLTAGDIFKLSILSLLMIIFTLGIGYAWVLTMNMRYTLNKISMVGDIDLNSIHQTQEEYKNSAGDSIGDLLNVDTII